MLFVPLLNTTRRGTLVRSLKVKERRCNEMKTAGVGLGMIGGMALAVTAVNAIYPDVWRRMKRDGKRAARAIKQSSLLK